MLTYVILLRAVNVGSTGKLPMADFRKLLEGLGYAQVETYIQSGNAVVGAKGSAAATAKAVGAALEKLMGHPVPVIVRTHAELERMIVANPFAQEAAADGARVFAVFLSAAPAAGKVAGLEAIATKNPKRRDRYHLAGDTLYLHLPDGAADSKFTAQTVDRVLGVTATARNWNTVLKLHSMAKR
ncbi:MAG: DUF1697 domain-containing protein [Terracidiphilus sp.]